MITDSQYSPKGFDVVRDQVSCANNLTILSEFKVLISLKDEYKNRGRKLVS